MGSQDGKMIREDRRVTRLALVVSIAVHLLALAAWRWAGPPEGDEGRDFAVFRLVKLSLAEGENTVAEKTDPVPEKAKDEERGPAVRQRGEEPAVGTGHEGEASRKNEARSERYAASEVDPPAEIRAAFADAVTAPPSGTESAKPLPGEIDEILAEIRRRIEARKRYPPLARRRGWEGSVTVEIELDGSGDLEGMRLLRPSGYAVLDRATIAAVSAAVPFPPLAGKVRIPISYRLD